MSDQVDGPLSIGESAADVSDLFAFTSPEHSARTVDACDRNETAIPGEKP